MPYVDGRQVASAVKAESPSTPVVLLTGWGLPMVAERDAPAQVDHVLSKPVDAIELRDLLASLLRRKLSSLIVAPQTEQPNSILFEPSLNRVLRASTAK